MVGRLERNHQGCPVLRTCWALAAGLTDSKGTLTTLVPSIGKVWPRRSADSNPSGNSGRVGGGVLLSDPWCPPTDESVVEQFALNRKKACSNQTKFSVFSENLTQEALDTSRSMGLGRCCQFFHRRTGTDRVAITKGVVDSSHSRQTLSCS